MIVKWDKVNTRTTLGDDTVPKNQGDNFISTLYYFDLKPNTHMSLTGGKNGRKLVLLLGYGLCFGSSTSLAPFG
jgi:hypothetical protein